MRVAGQICLTSCRFTSHRPPETPLDVLVAESAAACSSNLLQELATRRQWSLQGLRLSNKEGIKPTNPALLLQSPKYQSGRILHCVLHCSRFCAVTFPLFVRPSAVPTPYLVISFPQPSPFFCSLLSDLLFDGQVQGWSASRSLLDRLLVAVACDRVWLSLFGELRQSGFCLMFSWLPVRLFALQGSVSCHLISSLLGIICLGFFFSTPALVTS